MPGFTNSLASIYWYCAGTKSWRKCYSTETSFLLVILSHTLKNATTFLLFEWPATILEWNITLGMGRALLRKCYQKFITYIYTYTYTRTDRHINAHTDKHIPAFTHMYTHKYELLALLDYLLRSWTHQLVTLFQYSLHYQKMSFTNENNLWGFSYLIISHSSAP